MDTKVLIIGNGGREHALGWKLRQSRFVREIWYSPGNAGTGEEDAVIVRNTDFDGTEHENFDKVYDFIKREKIGMTIIGPEGPLVNKGDKEGIVDYLNVNGCNRVFGPTQSAVRLESDKFFSYRLMKELEIPQAEQVECYSTEQASRVIEDRFTEEGIVIKARGLAAGKGVSVCDTVDQAFRELERITSKYGSEVLIAERLFGEEFSLFGISDGEKVLPFKMAFQDYKRLKDNDEGPNTGGMGSYGPAPSRVALRMVIDHVFDKIMNPVVRRMKEKGCEYKGFLYAGMISTRQGPKVIEFNARFGDPEAQPAMMMLKTDLYEVVSAGVDGIQRGSHIEFNPGAACCVVMASPGYPGEYPKGFSISGLSEANGVEGVKVFHAGTYMDDAGILSSGGRVLGVTGYSDKGLSQAINAAYKGVGKIGIPGRCFDFDCRSDIGAKGLRVVR